MWTAMFRVGETKLLFFEQRFRKFCCLTVIVVHSPVTLKTIWNSFITAWQGPLLQLRDFVQE